MKSFKKILEEKEVLFSREIQKGDTVEVISYKSSKLDDEQVDFLKSKPYFEVIDTKINKNGHLMIDIGMKTDSGKVYWFLAKRFQKVMDDEDTTDEIPEMEIEKDDEVSNSPESEETEKEETTYTTGEATPSEGLPPSEKPEGILGDIEKPKKPRKKPYEDPDTFIKDLFGEKAHYKVITNERRLF